MSKGNLIKETPYSEITATLEALDRLGIKREQLSRLRSDSNYAKRVAAFILSGGISGSVHQKIAQQIMGNNFWGVEEWSSIYGVNFNQKHLRRIAEFPWSEEILNGPCPFWTHRRIRDTHFAFLGLDAVNDKFLTVERWREILDYKKEHPKFFYDLNELENPFFEEKRSRCNFRWYLMLKEPKPKMRFDDYDEIINDKCYNVPNIAEAVTFFILYSHKHNGAYPAISCLSNSKYSSIAGIGVEAITKKNPLKHYGIHVFQGNKSDVVESRIPWK